MLQTAGETDALKAVVSEGAGIRSIREQMLKPGAGQVAHGAVLGDADGRDRRLLEPRAAAEPERPRRPHLAAAGVPHLLRAPARR